MKKITLPLLFAFCQMLPLLSSQESPIPATDPWEHLYGYWYYEEIDSSDWHRGLAVQKLYFTKDSLIVSNFGDQRLFMLTCTSGSWSINHDTLSFMPDKSISFSTNTGFYYYGSVHAYNINKAGDSILELDISAVLKKVTQEELLVDIKLPVPFIPATGKLESRYFPRKFKKVTFQDMCTLSRK